MAETKLNTYGQDVYVEGPDGANNSPVLPYSDANYEEPPNPSIYSPPNRLPADPAPPLLSSVEQWENQMNSPEIRESREHAAEVARSGNPDVKTEVETTPGLLDGLANMKLDLSGLDKIGEAGKTVGFYVILGLALVLAIKLS